jgi:SPP1 gp7 family putative phage head morphogenesis protein
MKRFKPSIRLFQEEEKQEDNKDLRDAIIPQDAFQETTFASSSLYEDYQLRPFNPDELWQRKGNYDLYDSMREDDQISALLKLKKTMIIGDWEVVTDDEQVKEFIEWNFKHGLDKLFEQCLFGILSGLDYGFSITEKIFSTEETIKFGTKIILKNLKTRAPHSFDKIEQDDKGNIVRILQDTTGEDIEVKPNKVIHFVNQPDHNFDSPFGKSDLNVGIYRAWWSKDNIIKYWNIFLERFGMPTVFGRYPKGEGGQRAEFLKVLKNIQARSAIVMPEGFEAEFMQGGKSGSTSGGGYESAIDKYNMMIARALLVPDLMGFSGKEVSGGSFALGQEHFGIFFDIINNIRKQLERHINRDVVAPLLLWNFGRGVEAEFKFMNVDTGKRNDQYKIFLEAVNKGMKPTFEQWNHLLQGNEFPVFDESEIQQREEDMAVKKEREQLSFDANLENMKNGGGKPFDNPKDKPKDKKDNPFDKGKKPDKKDVIPKKPEVKKNTEDKEYVEMSEFEKRVDFQAIERETDNIESIYKEKLTEQFKLSINGLIDEIKRGKIIEKKKISSVNKLKLKGVSKVTSIIKDMTKQAAKLGKTTAQAEINQHKAKEFVIDGVPELNNIEVAEWLSEHAFYVSDMEAGFILGKVKPIISDSIRNGTSTKETIKLIDTALKGYDVAVGAARVENIVRTTTAKAFNEVRMQEFGKVADEIQGYFYSIILDKRTSNICKSLDSNKVGVYKPNELPDINPPNHFQCRSIAIPVFNDESVDKFADLSDIDVEKVDSSDFFKSTRKKDATN